MGIDEVHKHGRDVWRAGFSKRKAADAEFRQLYNDASRHPTRKEAQAYQARVVRDFRRNGWTCCICRGFFIGANAEVPQFEHWTRKKADGTRLSVCVFSAPIHANHTSNHIFTGNACSPARTGVGEENVRRELWDLRAEL